MPTTVGIDETSMGASADPLGCVVIARDGEEEGEGDELECDRKQILPGRALAPSRALCVYLARCGPALMRRVSSSTSTDRSLSRRSTSAFEDYCYYHRIETQGDYFCKVRSSQLGRRR